MKRILVAKDSLIYPDKVLDYAKNLSKELNAEILIIHSESVEAYINSIVSETQEQPSIELIEFRKKQIQQKLEKIHSELSKEGIQSEYLLMEGPTVDNILKEADIFKADMIIIGSHKHGKFYHLLIGSIHNSLISRSNIPVLVIPSEENT